MSNSITPERLFENLQPVYGALRDAIELNEMADNIQRAEIRLPGGPSERGITIMLGTTGPNLRMQLARTLRSEAAERFTDAMESLQKVHD